MVHSGSGFEPVFVVNRGTTSEVLSYAAL